MNSSRNLFLLLISCVFLLSAETSRAFAPSSLVGKLNSISIYDSESGKTYRNDNIFISPTQAWQYEYENGDWELKEYEYTSNGSFGTLKWGAFPSGGWAMEATFTFTSTNAGTASFTEYELNDQGELEVDYQGTASFTIRDYSTNDLPPFDNFFSDNFTNSSDSENYWYENIETGWYGLTVSKTNGRLELLGTVSDPEELFFDVNSKSLLPLNESWIVEADLFSNLTANTSETWHTKVGFEIEYSNTDIEFHIGPYNYGVHAGITFENATSWTHMSTTSVYLDQGSFRIRNDASSHSVHLEYFDESANSWISQVSLNLETGEVTGTTYSTSSNTNQFDSWVSLVDARAQPGLDFKIPHINEGETIRVSPLTSGDMGATRFSIIKEHLPDSLQNKKMTITYETESGASGTNYNYFLDDDTVKVHYLAGTEDAFWDEESYTWSESGNNQISSSITNSNGRVVTGELNFESKETGTFTLKFYEPSNGELAYQESATGTFSISDFTAEELPLNKGWMWFDHYPWVYSHIESGWLYFKPTGSRQMVYSVKDQVWREME